MLGYIKTVLVDDGSLQVASIVSPTQPIPSPDHCKIYKLMSYCLKGK